MTILLFNCKIMIKMFANIHFKLLFFSTIAKPFEGRMTYGKALILIICIWIYVLPWCLLPLTEKWNRFVPGELIKLHKHNMFFQMNVAIDNYLELRSNLINMGFILEGGGALLKQCILSNYIIRFV